MSLPNPNQIVIKPLPKAMPFGYDITKDICYKQGKEQGME